LGSVWFSLHLLVYVVQQKPVTSTAFDDWSTRSTKDGQFDHSRYCKDSKVMNEYWHT
jgi:hypothetical protein